jgi:hypothetical protein
MSNPPITPQQQIMNMLIRIDRKLDDIERRLKTVEQDVHRVKREVRS